MTYILIIIFFAIGIFLASFSLVPILIILFFGIPATRRLERANMLNKGNGIVKKYIASMTILLVIFLAALVIIFFFLPGGVIGFIIGALVSVLVSLNKLGFNQNNFSDYCDTNKRHFAVDLKEISVRVMSK